MTCLSLESKYFVLSQSDNRCLCVSDYTCGQFTDLAGVIHIECVVYYAVSPETLTLF